MDKLLRLPLDFNYPAEIKKIKVTIPSSAAKGETIAMNFEFTDKYGFHLSGHPAKLQLEVLGGRAECRKEIIIRNEADVSVKEYCKLLDEDTVYRIKVYDKERGLFAISNPCKIAEPKFSSFNLYFGDIHAHRYEIPSVKKADPLLRSRGPATVEEFYRYARDVVSLDFAALTDHDYALTSEDWREMQEGAEYFNQPDRFVTFLGYEWAWNFDIDADYGHRVILYKSDRMPLISSNWKGTNTPQGLYSMFDRLSSGEDIISIPHHSARRVHKIWLNWDSLSNKYDRLFEVFSMWGCSEKQGEPFAIKNSNECNQWEKPDKDYPPCEASGHFAVDGLRKGFRFGFTGGSESHDGRAGFPVMHAHMPLNQLSFNYQGGLTGIWARRKTRDALWGSLWNRRTIATTGQRTIAYMEIDGVPCGGSLETESKRGTLRGFVHACSSVSSLMIVKNNQDWREVSTNGMDSNFSFDDIEFPEKGRTDWYYLRITESDGNMVWTSPVWVCTTTD
ncbi:MAG: DUF3604 domain-containing protein [Clostridiaceae bacterium]|nr:DUF3604 domain-containing protein [Clostridiaceae bacterium]